MAAPLSSAYRAKSEALRSVVQALGQDIDQLLDRYSGLEFGDSHVEKKQVFVEVLDLDPTEGTLEFLEDRCGRLSHFKDRRSGAEYAADLIFAWLAEDAVVRRLELAGHDAVLSGHDRYREFLAPKLISTQPDIRILTQSGPRLLEVFSDWTGYWRKTGLMDLRDAKYDRLVQEEALMLGLAPRSEEGFLIDFQAETPPFQQVVNPRYGGKWVYQSDQARQRLRPIDQVLTAIEYLVKGGS